MTLTNTVRLGLRAGLCVLPVKNDGSKAPDVSRWREYQTTRPTLEQIKEWDFAHRAGIGMIAGPVSGRRECWDFDCRHTFDAFIAAAGASGLGAVVQRIRVGYEDQTPGGGVRWIVSYPASVEWRDCTLARRPGRDGEPPVKVLIELPTFAIMAPSNGTTHPSGRAYVRLAGDPSTIASYTEDERDALLELARSFDQMPRRAAEPTRRRTAPATGTRPGDVFTARTTWPEILEPHDWTFVYARGETAYWRRPGKMHGVSASTNVGGSDLFFPFTSSTVFEADKSYSRFGAYAVLEHGGDFARAALALAEQGYGSASSDRRQARPAAPEAATAASWRWLADVERQHVEWLWRYRLARGTLTIWMGDGGLGKSRASNDVVARLTTGAAWPDGDRAPLGTAIILSAEDSASHTTRPAIEAAGGDLTRVAVLDAVRDDTGTERTFNLSTDVAALEELLTATGAALVVIDPLSAYFGTALDSYRDTDVRAVLEPIVKLAERHGVAVLGIMHIGKGTDRQARHRALGSVAFVNAARLVFAVGPDPNDDTRRLLAPVKANICREAPTLAFRLEDVQGVPRVVWDGAPVVGVNADTVLNGKSKATDEDDRDAESVIRELLEDEAWPLDAKAALEAGRAQGIPERTMRCAARRLGVQIRKLGFRGRWLWHRPSAEGASTGGDTPEAPAADAGSDATTAKGHEAASVCAVAPSVDLAPSEPDEAAIAPSAPSQNIQQNTHDYEGASSHTPRAREKTAHSRRAGGRAANGNGAATATWPAPMPDFAPRGWQEP